LEALPPFKSGTSLAHELFMNTWPVCSPGGREEQVVSWARYTSVTGIIVGCLLWMFLDGQLAVGSLQKYLLIHDSIQGMDDHLACLFSCLARKDI
jgi:hypothetical protein